MRNRYARAACLLGLSLLATGCYNNPETTERHPGEGAADFHRKPDVGPGTTAGGSTAGPQPPAREKAEAAPAAATPHAGQDAGHQAGHEAPSAAPAKH
jgi:hypothetical protein